MPSANAIRAGKAIIELGMPTAEVEKAMHKLAARAKTIGSQFQMVGKIGMAAGGAIAAAFVPTIQAASNLEETMNKFNVVFGEAAGAVKEWSDNFAATVGRSQRQIADFMAGTQDLFVPLGFEPGAATEMSQQLTALAIDLASFNNMADDAVLRDLQAALTGSGEVMKKYGVLVSEAAVKQELLRQGMDPKNATDQEKVLARLNIIMQGTTAAQGDAARSAGSFANQMKALRGKLEDVAAQIGTAILPLVTDFVTKLVDVTKNLGDWVEKNQSLIVTVAKIGAVTAAAGTGLYALGKAFTVASVAVRAFSVAMTFAMANPMIAAISAMAAAIALITGAWLAAKRANEEYTRQVQNSMHNDLIEQAGLGDLAASAEGKGGSQPTSPRARGAGPMTPAEAARERANSQAAAAASGASLLGVAARIDGGLAESLLNSARNAASVVSTGFVDGVNAARDAKRRLDLAALNERRRQRAEAKQKKEEADEAVEDAVAAVPQNKFTGAIFDARFAAQQFGGGNETNKLLRDIKRNTDPKNQQPGGVAVAKG